MKQNWQETRRGGLEFGKSVEIENGGDGSGNEKGLDQGEENLMNVWGKGWGLPKINRWLSLIGDRRILKSYFTEFYDYRIEFSP